MNALVMEHSAKYSHLPCRLKSLAYSLLVEGIILYDYHLKRQFLDLLENK